MAGKAKQHIVRAGIIAAILKRRDVVQRQIFDGKGLFAIGAVSVFPLVKPHEFSVVDVHGFYLLFYETRPPAWHYRIGINRTTTAEIASFAWFFVHLIFSF
jgi:hypothetical protein